MKMKIETLGKMRIFDSYKRKIFLMFSEQFEVLIPMALSVLRGVAPFLRSSQFYMEPRDPRGDPWGHPKKMSGISSIQTQLEALSPNPLTASIDHPQFRRYLLGNEMRNSENENENRNSWENEDF